MTIPFVISKRNKHYIWYFVFVFFILPTIQVSGLSSVVGRFIPNPLGYNLLAFILSIPLLRSFNKNYGNLKSVVFAIILLVLYCISNFIATANKTSFIEALTVFRYSYMQVFNLLILIPFMFSLKKDEVDYTLHCIFKCLVAFIFIYLSNNLIYDWLGVKGHLSENVNGASIDRSIIGMPLLDPIWTALLMTYAVLKVPKAWKHLGLILLTIVISFTRNILFSTLIISFVVIFLFILKNLNNIERAFKIILVIILGFVFMSIVMPNAIDFWIAKLSMTFNEDLAHDVGTFAFREKLVEDAIYAIRHDQLLGLGYVRDVAKGEYSIVMGGDTYIAPILWCEGWLGLILRILPFIVLGLTSISNIFTKSKNYWLDIVIIACIIASSVNYIQTKALTEFPLILGIIILVKIKDNYDRKTQDFGNYSIL